MTIRTARGADRGALERLAQLDSARLPRGPLLVAEAGDRILAAYSLPEGRPIADPFRPTADLVALLALRGRQIDNGGHGSRLRLRRRSVAPQPPGFAPGLLPARFGRPA